MTYNRLQALLFVEIIIATATLAKTYFDKYRLGFGRTIVAQDRYQFKAEWRSDMDRDKYSMQYQKYIYMTCTYITSNMLDSVFFMTMHHEAIGLYINGIRFVQQMKLTIATKQCCSRSMLSSRYVKS